MVALSAAPMPDMEASFTLLSVQNCFIEATTSSPLSILKKYLLPILNDFITPLLPVQGTNYKCGYTRIFSPSAFSECNEEILARAVNQDFYCIGKRAFLYNKIS
jgi:hypothetical protein